MCNISGIVLFWSLQQSSSEKKQFVLKFQQQRQLKLVKKECPKLQQKLIHQIYPVRLGMLIMTAHHGKQSYVHMIYIVTVNDTNIHILYNLLGQNCRYIFVVILVAHFFIRFFRVKVPLVVNYGTPSSTRSFIDSLFFGYVR